MTETSNQTSKTANESTGQSHSQSTDEITIGVLALQGAFLEHITALRTLNQLLNQSDHPIKINVIEVRTANDLEHIDGLVLPGGESTAQGLVAARENILSNLQSYCQSERPVFGTCAGLIIQADSVRNQKKGGQHVFGGLKVEVQRNHYGTQLGSFQTMLKVPVFEKLSYQPVNQSNNQDPTLAPAVFIRAPGITRTSPGVEILASLPKEVDSAPVKQGSFNRADEQPDNQSTTQFTVDYTSSDQSIVPVAVRQGNKIGTTFHPELTPDLRWHMLFVDIVRDYKKSKSV